MKEIYLKTPVIDKNKVVFSWEPNYVFKADNYWVKYIDFDKIHCSPDALAEAYLPVCIALAALGDIVVRLPSRINEDTLNQWLHLIKVIAKRLYKQSCKIKIINGEGKIPAVNNSSTETALLFGGGIESLVTLDQLRKNGISPILISYGGPGWLGSDPEINKDKFIMDKKISNDLNLRLVTVSTNFRDLIDNNIWHPYLRKKVNLINAALFLPFNIFSLAPVAQQLRIKKVVSGNEKENNVYEEYFSMSKDVTYALFNASNFFNYESTLNNLWKVEVMRDLYTRNYNLVKYQYSCWKNKGNRWCSNCEKCFRNYVAMKIYNINPSIVGLDEELIHSNLKKIIWEVRWGIVKNPVLKEEWRKIYDEIKKTNNGSLKKMVGLIYRKYYLRKAAYPILRFLERIK